MLVGEPPFTGPTAQAVVAKMMTTEPAGLIAQRKTIPVPVEIAVLTALQKLPADRFASAAEFAQALGGQADGRTVGRTHTQATSPHRPIPTSRLITGMLLAAMAVLAAWGWLRPGRTAETSRQRVTLWRHPIGQLLAPGAVFEATQAAIAPDGSSIVFCDDISDSARLMLKLRNAAEARPLSGTEGGVSPFYSPDGKWIGFVTTNGRVKKVPVEGGGAITIATDADLTGLAAAWLDDGTIVYISLGRGLRRVGSDGGNSRPVQNIAQSQRLTLATLTPLPGSRGVLFTACPGNCGLQSDVYGLDFTADSGRLLVHDAAGAWYSPTGHLLYTDRAGGLFAAGFDAKSLTLTSGAVPVIENVAPASFAISATGSVLYSVAAGGGASSQLVWVARDGRAEPVDSNWRTDFEYPALSPDGKAVAVSVHDGSTQLWIRRSDGTRQKLTDSGSVNWRPNWAADGRSLTFLSNRGGRGSQDDYDVYQVPVDGSAPARRLQHHSFGLWEAEMSRDGQWLVVRSDENGGDANIRGRRLHGDTTLIPLLVDKSLTIQFSLSPDGHWLAYSSDATGRREIYVTPFPEVTSSHLVSRDGGTEPRWAHSGRELFFKGGNKFMAVPIASGPTFVAGIPHPLFPLSGYRSARNRQQYDVTPDDQHFVMIRELGADAPGNVVYVENWFAELEARMKAKR
jgi:serine/threonine-protein kinase